MNEYLFTMFTDNTSPRFMSWGKHYRKGGTSIIKQVPCHNFLAEIFFEKKPKR